MDLKLKAKNRLYSLVAISIVVLVVVFLLGINIGNGRIQVPLFNSAMNSVSGSLPSSLDYASVNSVYQSLKENYDGKLTESQLENGLKHGLANATNDPYTEYFTPAEAHDFNSQLNNAFSGIGAELGKDSHGNLQVISPIAGAPAAAAGLQAQDIIAGINNTSTSGMSVDQAVNKIRGPSGSKVTLQVVRNNTQTLDITIIRKNIVVPSVTTKTLPGNIGYMQISTFADDTTDLSQKAANQFKSSNVKAIILDLRDDPGGELNAAESVSSLWLNPGQTILQEKRGTQVISTDNASGSNPLHGIPTVVLINAGSASASEITAGALHDHGYAYLIGEKSYGKGVVQQLVNFNDGAQLKVTIASWYRPNGQNINHKGIMPDKTVPSPANATAVNDPQLQAAETYLASH